MRTERRRVASPSVAGATPPCPEATVARLATYLRVLGTLGERGITTVSSEELAAASPGSTRPSCARTCPTSAPTASAASATTSPR